MKKRFWLENECNEDAFVSYEIPETDTDQGYFGLRECSISIFDGSRMVTRTVYLPPDEVRFERCKTKEEAREKLHERIEEYSRIFTSDITNLRDIAKHLDDFIRLAGDAFVDQMAKMSRNSVKRLGEWEDE